MQPTTKSATDANSTHRNAAGTKLSLSTAIGVYLITMAMILPLSAIGNQSGHIWVNFAGVAYLGVLVAIGKTNIGKRWSRLVDSSTEKLFTIPRPRN